MVKIADYLDVELIVDLDPNARDQIIYSLVNLLKEKKVIKDVEPFYQAVLDREAIVSTGIGMGVAIPHAKLPLFENFFIVIARLSKGMDWNALDKEPVRLIFLIGGPDDKQTEYLKILSKLTNTIRDEERRKKMLTAKSGQAMMELLKEY
jgi:nitrogen PTS system EIIA component